MGKIEKIKQPKSGVIETAHLNTDKKKFDEGWDRVFGKKEVKEKASVKDHRELLQNALYYIDAYLVGESIDGVNEWVNDTKKYLER